MKSRNLLLARKLAREGFVVIPLLRDAKRPAVRWKRFQAERPTDAELVEWFGDTSHEPAIVTGHLSGITAIDCDNAMAVERCERAGVVSPVRQTTSRGVHLVFRHNGERNTTGVAGMSGVDRRGEGGYIRAYPESVHWTRERIDACDVAPPIATEDGRNHRHDCAESLPAGCSIPGENATSEECVWDAGRKAWRHDYLDDGQPQSVWLYPVTFDSLEDATAASAGELRTVWLE
jgi:hypothetical protein